MSSEPEDYWAVYASPTYATQVFLVKGAVSRGKGFGYINGYCLDEDMIFETEGEAKRKALKVIESRMEKLLSNIELLNNLAEDLLGD